MTGSSRDSVLGRADALQPELLRDLQVMIRQPSVSATGEGIHECSRLVSGIMRDSGIRTEILQIDGAPPLVYGEVLSRANPDKTLLFYNHYDVQPPDPVSLWDDPPFSGKVSGNKVFGRGSADDKGELATRIKATKAYLEACGDVPCNIKFVVEGEEETGSANVARYLERHRERFSCDGVVWEFGFVDSKDRPIVGLGMKGLLYVELSAKGPVRDAHSSLAVLIGNPAWQLVRSLGSMRNDDGKVLVRDWYREVRPLSEMDLELIGREPFDEDRFKREFGVDGFVAGRSGIAAKIALASEPTCNIAGMLSGYTGEGSKTVLPATATAKIDFRLVPDMDPEMQFQRLKDHLKSEGFGDIRARATAMVPPSRTDPSHDFVGQVESSAREAFGDAILNVSNPGTGPMHQFASILQAPCISVGSTYIFAGIHSPNEFARLDLMKKTTRCLCLVMERFGQRQARTGPSPR